MSWLPYINVNGSDSFFAAMKNAVNESPEWRMREMDDFGAGPCLTADYEGEEFTGDDLGVVFLAHSDTPDRIQMTMHAVRWRDDSSFPRDDEYARAESLAATLIKAAGRELGRGLRLSRPKDPIRPLTGALAKDFQLFCFGATDLWAGKKMLHLHPLEQLKFWRFVRTAHQYTSVLRPSDVRCHLREEGFTSELTDELVAEYEVGRRVLALDLYPWELRSKRKRHLTTRRHEDAREDNRENGRPQSNADHN